jgi:hypothetical protein
VGLLGVLADIGVDGGPGGGAALATVTLRFESAAAAPVAEPSPMLLLWPAIAAAVWLGRRSVFGLRHPHVVPRAQA